MVLWPGHQSRKIDSELELLSPSCEVCLARARRSGRTGWRPPDCDRAADLTLRGAMVLMAERICLLLAIVFSIVVPIAVMVALVYMK